MVFTGTYEHSIDAKKRLAIPAEVRAILVREAEAAKGSGTNAGENSGGSSGGSVSVYLTLGEGQALCLYTERGFEQRAAELDQSELDPEELLEYERILFSQTAKLELDGQGRVRLPEHLLQKSGLGTDVVLIGVKDHLEIRDRQAWQKHVEETLRRHPGILMNPRRAMRKPPGTATSASAPSGQSSERGDVAR